MGSRFRHDPPEPRQGWIRRPRLERRFDRRFEVPVVVVVAPAGFGKTAALSQALAATRDDPSRVDIWLQCEPADADAEVLGPAILRSAGVSGDDRSTVDAATLADALLRFAPQKVCLVLDDLHKVADGSPGLDLIAGLVEALPLNAHLVLSGRTDPALPLARSRLLGAVDRITSDDLEFDDAELDEVVADGHHVPDEAARWPAFAALATEAAPGDTVNFLLEEVAQALGVDRTAALVALAHVQEVDEEVARAASDGELGASDLLGELPLVQRSPGGTYQMHDLWTETLSGDRVREPQAVAAVTRVADLVLDRGNHILATELFGLVSETDGVMRAALDFSSQPLMFVSAADLRRMAALTAEHLSGHALARLLAGTVAITGGELTSVEAFEEAAREAAEAGDDLVEALALQNAVNMRAVIEPRDMPGWLDERATVLAGRGLRVGLAASAAIRAHNHRLAGDPEASATVLQDLAPARSDMEAIVHAFGMGDLGRPELVATPAEPEQANTAAAQAGGQYLAQAIWLRGEVPPEIALELGTELAETADDGRVVHVQISTSGVLCLVALAAGDLAAARRFSANASRLVGATASEPVRAFAALGEALCLLCSGDEPAARARVASMLAANPMDLWPIRPYLYALPAIYVLAPETRSVLDACRFGPAVQAAVDAGRALVALREEGDPAPANALAWDRPWLLRAHVLPPHLSELAAAAAASGNGEVGAVMAQIPDLREHLAAAAELDHGPTAAWAAQRITTLPARPAYEMNVGLLGTVTLARGDTTVTDPAWLTRDRVRQILAYLLLHRRASRRRMAEALWPGLDVKKGLGNLRVNLSHLQKVLQPARGTGDRPWFVQADSEMLMVSEEGWKLDTDEFETACREGRHLDDRAQGTRAMTCYRRATDLYRGDYLEEWPDVEWADIERVRLRSLATAARCRLGELLLARGEPEEAADMATIALRDEPLHERTGRLLIHSFSGQGNRAAAQRATRDLLDRLISHDLEPDRETEILARSLGISTAGAGRGAG